MWEAVISTVKSSAKHDYALAPRETTVLNTVVQRVGTTKGQTDEAHIIWGQVYGASIQALALELDSIRPISQSSG